MTNNGRFKKGHVPHNKGKKGLRKGSSTCFKKGNIPHNAHKDGTITIRKDSKGREYYHLKVEGIRKMIMLHVHLWNEAYGLPEKGHIVVFKDGNTMNCVLDNLECISRAELLRRNNQERRELIELIKGDEQLYRIYQLTNKLKKRIKKLKKKTDE